MQKKELYINLSEETRLSFFMMPVLTKQMRPWFYEKYINLVMHAIRMDRGGTIYMIDFIDNKVDESYREYMQERIVYSYDEAAGDLINHVKKQIDKDFYIYTNVDKYYIPDDEVYMQRHFVHPVLIFGYDDEKGEILCIEQSFTKGAMKCGVKYEDYEMSFKGMEEHYNRGADKRVVADAELCFKLKKDPYIAPFKIERFLSELYDYLNSTIGPQKERQMYFYSTDMVYGISVYDKFTDEINKFGGNHTMTFKSLQDFLRHKQYLLERFAYIESIYEISGRCKDKMTDYKKVCELINTARSLGIKYDMKNNVTPAIGLSKNPEFLIKLKNVLAEAKKEENEILSEIYAELKKEAKQKNKNTNGHFLEWDFAKSRIVSDISDFVYPESGNDVFCGTITDRHPGIVYDTAFALDGEKAKYIYVKYRTTCNSESAQFFFVSENSKIFSEDNSKIFTTNPNGKSYEYIIDMSDKPEWKGMITQMRFNPTGSDNKSETGELAVEYVKISDNLPIYGSEKDFAKTQGVNNWSYHTFNGELTYREMQWSDENERWDSIQLSELTIEAKKQSSHSGYAAVRRWTCPAGGKYKIDCAFEQTTNGAMTEFLVKRNHAVLNRYICENKDRLSDKYHAEIELEKGEIIGFEFRHEDDFAAYLNAEITISKLDI